MTFQPPPPPPEGQPSQPGPPTPPPYGGPGGSPQPRPGAGFDPKSINPLDWGIFATGVLAFIFSFTSYYSGSLGPLSAHINAWHGFFGWFAALVALVGSAAVAMALFAPQVKLNAPPRTIALVAYAVATVCVILAIFIIPIDAPSEVNLGHGFGFWISLIVIIVGLLLSLMRFQQTGGQLPGALSKIPDIGSRGPGGNQPPPPPPPGAGPPRQ